MSDPSRIEREERLKEGAERGHGKTVALIGAAATVLAAVITGVFALTASHGGNAGTPSVVTTILQPLGTGGPGAQDDLPKSDAGGAFLADAKALKDPWSSDFAQTIGGRSVVKSVGLLAGTDAQYSIPATAKKFLASVGLGDNDINADAADVGTFSVYGDSTELGQVTLKRGQLAEISASVSGHKVLQLGYSSTNGSSVGAFGLARLNS
jgi:hypothetical protein